MKIICILFIVSFGTIAIDCYEQYIGNARHPDYPEKCYYRDHKRPLKFGEVYRPTNTGECHKITCRSDYVLRIDSCPRFQVGDNCKVISGNLAKPFPKCCASIACPDQNGQMEVRPTYTEFY